jgi:hypothetical protein
MTANPPQFPPKCSPFGALLRNGLDRLFDFVPADLCTFIVNGEHFQTSFAEAIVLSPMACDVLKFNPMGRTFDISTHSVDAKTFQLFLNFALSREPLSLSRDAARSFIPVCQALGNELLALSLLSLMKGISGESMIDISDSTVDVCASRFYSYSIEDIRLFDSVTLHRLLSSPSLLIESEDTLLGQLITLDSGKSEFWGYIEVEFLSSKGISIFADALSIDELTDSIWMKIVLRLKGICDDGIRSRRFRAVTFDSAILKQIPDFLSDIGSLEWTLLYRGSRDGFQSSNFHGKCDGRSNTVTIILTVNDGIIGGFTPIAWNSRGNYETDHSGKSFVFTLKNARHSPPRKFALSRLTQAIFCHSGSGPTFGSGHDIFIANECNATSENYTNFGHSYVNDTGIDGKQVLLGEYAFTVKEVEVFEIRQGQ